MAARATVIAAVSPTRLVTAAGTVHDWVCAGDRGRKGQTLTRVSRPLVQNEYQHPRAALTRMNAGLADEPLKRQEERLRGGCGFSGRGASGNLPVQNSNRDRYP